MLFAYIDESKDDNKFYIYSALVIDGDKWVSTFEKVKAFRRQLKAEYGIFTAQELHAWKFAAGKGRISHRVILKPERAEIFRKVMRFIAESRCFAVVSSCNSNEQYAFERLMNRINRTVEARKQNILMFFDEGEQHRITGRIRRMRVYNPIPSNRGTWTDGGIAKSIPLSRFIEDPVFKDSSTSYFIQLADFCAYALLRMERPIESRTLLGYDTMYEELRPVCRPLTNRNDPRKMGIIR